MKTELIAMDTAHRDVVGYSSSFSENGNKHNNDQRLQNVMLTTLFTSSYIKDLDRAVWMRRSVIRFLKDPCRHLIAVPNKDIPAFKRQFRDDRLVEIVSQSDAVSKVFYPDMLHGLVSNFAKSQLWRFESHSGRPGWIIQQIAKLNCTHWIKGGALIFIDSDVIFTRPFDLHELGINSSERALIRITPQDEASRHRNHLIKAREILALPAGPTNHHYLSNPAVWYPDWIEALHNHIELTSNTDWQTALFRAGHISEFTIYGAFVEEVLKPANLQLTTTPYHSGAWDLAALNNLKTGNPDVADATHHGLVLVVQSNIGIPLSEYEEILRKIIDA